MPETSGGVAPTTAHVAALSTVAAALGELGARQIDVALPSGPSLYEIFVPHQMAEAHHVHHSDPRHVPGEAASTAPTCEPGSRRPRRSRSLTTSTPAARRRSAAGSSRRSGRRPRRRARQPVWSEHGRDPNAVDVDGRSVPLRDAVMPSTVPQNIAGLPSVTVPAEYDADGLPIGVQISGRPWSEPLLLAVAEALELAGACRQRPDRFTASDPDHFSKGA